MAAPTQRAPPPRRLGQVRAALEKYLCDNDVSCDGVRTPMVVLVVNGGAPSHPPPTPATPAAIPAAAAATTPRPR